ncbi:hypothetical protein [Demequina zhanjiangensis]|uniref:Antitoxin n=1 Tax=Demequina zhanjiangensis TaxID=3051659 RepID=A0ABT8G0T3_9MICO|nr:hypothetical protein [Demequina sp. SYSU T00b26]MDN4472756.1 hypothetical protein [Demequina sp. SYSU T00b26]
MSSDEIKAKAQEALPDDEQAKKLGDKVRENTPDGVDVPAAKAEQWVKDHNKD